MHNWIIETARGIDITGNWYEWLFLVLLYAAAWCSTELVRNYYRYQGNFFDLIGLVKVAHTPRIMFGVVMIGVVWVMALIFTFLTAYMWFAV